MALPEVLQNNLRIPVVGSPLFLVSGPELVIAQCKAGIVGSFPALNARPSEVLDEWLTRINTELEEYKEANPDKYVAPMPSIRFATPQMTACRPIWKFA